MTLKKLQGIAALIVWVAIAGLTLAATRTNWLALAGWFVAGLGALFCGGAFRLIEDLSRAVENRKAGQQ